MRACAVHGCLYTDCTVTLIARSFLCVCRVACASHGVRVANVKHSRTVGPPDRGNLISRTHTPHTALATEIRQRDGGGERSLKQTDQLARRSNSIE